MVSKDGRFELNPIAGSDVEIKPHLVLRATEQPSWHEGRPGRIVFDRDHAERRVTF